MKDKYQEHKRPRIAVLIDGDNARPSLIGKYLTEAGKFGTVTLRRIYGDWTTPNMNSWKTALNNHAVQPIQQFRYTVGKNATDSALIIDAMDILHGELVDGFCIVSSDSDYTRMATRIRESGIFVMGIGESKTPKPFVNACNLFIYTENLLPEETEVESESGTTANGRKTTRKGRSTKPTKPKPDPIPILKEAFNLAADENDWARLSEVGSQLRSLDPGFDPRTFGYGRLSQLIRAQDKLFTMRYENDKGPSAIYVKLKD